MTGTRAAVDVGTNSTRLLVVDAAGDTITREMTITRLGHGVDERGHLDDEALQRTLDTIRRYRKAWDRHGAQHIRIAATSAVRDATDRDRFFDGVRDIAGVDVEVLTGEEEARTTFRGVLENLDLPGSIAVIDVGGGSTEFVVGDRQHDVGGVVSLQLGCVRLTERLLASDPPTGAEIDAARQEVREQLDRGAADLRDQGADLREAQSLVGVAGTVTTLAALHLQLDRYEPERIHGTWIPDTAVRLLTGRLAGMTADERARLGPMSPGREDVIFGGALIVETTLERFGFAGLYASEADILDGLVACD